MSSVVWGPINTSCQSCGWISVAERNLQEFFFISLSIHFYFYFFFTFFQLRTLWCLRRSEDRLIYVFIPFCLDYKGSVCPSSLYISLSWSTLSPFTEGGKKNSIKNCLQPAPERPGASKHFPYFTSSPLSLEPPQVALRPVRTSFCCLAHAHFSWQQLKGNYALDGGVRVC